jgi:hypothetical protein
MKQYPKGCGTSAVGRLIPSVPNGTAFRQVLLQPVLMRMGLPTPDLWKLDNYELSGHRPFDLLVLGKEALAERGT